jgi:FkbM family methyltransferase
MNIKNATLRALMRSGRKLFRNTPIQGFGLTTKIYSLLAKSAFPQEFLHVEFRGVTIKYPGRDHTTLPTLVEGRYEQVEFDRVLEFLDALPAPVDVLDVGANVGIWTCVLAGHPNVNRVVAFEPSRETIRLLRENIASNGFADKVTVVESAVAKEVGVVNFTSDGSTATRHIETNSVGSDSVTATSIDVFVETSGFHPGFIKVDVEGYEPLVLDGARATIDAWHPALLLEYSLPQTTSANLSWHDCGPRLMRQYSSLEVLSDSSRKAIKDFSEIASDKRLLNLFASGPTKAS